MCLSRFYALAVTAFATLVICTSASADPIRANSGFDSNVRLRNDGSATRPVSSAGNKSSRQNNGNPTFGSGGGASTPFGLPTNRQRDLVAPFFADVDSRNAATATVNDGLDVIDGRSAFGASFGNGNHNPVANRLNAFQAVLRDRSGAARDASTEPPVSGGNSGGNNALPTGSSNAGGVGPDTSGPAPQSSLGPSSEDPAAGESSFNGVQLPPGFGDDVSIGALGCTQSAAGSLSLVDLATLCPGSGGSGLSSFIDNGIDPLVDSANPAALPTFLTSNNRTGGSGARAVVAAVPEPLAVLLLGVGLARLARRRAIPRR